MRASPVGYGGAFVGGRGRGLGGQGVSDAGARREALGCAARCSCEKKFPPRVPLRPSYRLVPPATSVGKPLFFVRHTARRTLRGVQLARQGWERGVGEKGARTRCAGGPFRLRILVCVRATAGLDGGAPWSQRDAHRSATASLRMGGYQRIKKPATGFPEPSPTGGRARSRGTCVSTGARVPRAGASAARRTRPVKKEKKAAARRAPTAGEAHRMHAGNSSSHALQKTCCAQSTRRRACYKVFRLRRRGGRWVGGTGRALERAPRR